jgi:hypothetical protein
MPMDEYLFLLAGMLDVTNPALTEPRVDKVNRLAKEAHCKVVGQKKQPRGWR